ncbi:sigma-54 interaction domain-containing protein [Aurantibacillus circumpalustris]|uniref:sigma-54 interaction domain-containing protein n=1 Tax=Aurantibacillus circumpalustris TaxID=3036359 RepID=UPI00295B334F|nr:sigma-54 dependent transcriptional regulator [Aurantibacillus circumpalustris]
MNTQDLKQKFGIIGNNVLLERAVDIARQVAPTDLNVVINGESGTGKEVFPQIIHQNSARKHGPYIAVNCGAIPEGTIDSELFGHEKGAFTGATEARKGYFEVANGGTIFLDEVGELPLATQARLLRVLESGEYIKVGSSKVQKTDVRVVAATNINFYQALEKEKFRADLYYRLNTVPIYLPPLRERKDDIHLLFRKFANDFAAKYSMPVLRLAPDAEQVLVNYYWPGNIRQLKNIAEQVSIIEKSREINADTLLKYLPQYNSNNVPSLLKADSSHSGFENDREIIFKVLRDTRAEINELKKIVFDLMSGDSEKVHTLSNESRQILNRGYDNNDSNGNTGLTIHKSIGSPNNVQQQVIEVEETLSLQDKEIDMIKKALRKHKGKRKNAAKELGISERTLYRKINEYTIEE